MFQKYINKISNTIGTVNYLQQKSRKPHSRRSSKNRQLLFDDGYDVTDVDPNTINKMEIDLSINGSRKGSLSDDYYQPNNTQIILSAAVAKLRNTLFYHSLVFLFHFFCFVLFLSVFQWWKFFLFFKFK